MHEYDGPQAAAAAPTQSTLAARADSPPDADAPIPVATAGTHPQVAQGMPSSPDATWWKLSFRWRAELENSDLDTSNGGPFSLANCVGWRLHTQDALPADAFKPSGLKETASAMTLEDLGLSFWATEAQMDMWLTRSRFRNSIKVRKRKSRAQFFLCAQDGYVDQTDQRGHFNLYESKDSLFRTTIPNVKE